MIVHQLSQWKIWGRNNLPFSKTPSQFERSFYFLCQVFMATFSASGETTKENLFETIKEGSVALCSASFDNVIVANFLFFSFQYCSTFKRIHWNFDAANSSFPGKRPASVLPAGEPLGRSCSRWSCWLTEPSWGGGRFCHIFPVVPVRASLDCTTGGASLTFCLPEVLSCMWLQLRLCLKTCCVGLEKQLLKLFLSKYFDLTQGGWCRWKRIYRSA